jgi:hypothetical protein
MFNSIKSLLEEYMRKQGIPAGKCPIMFAIDETTVVKAVMFDNVTESLVGFCGEECPLSGKHVCNSPFVSFKPVGPDQYEQLLALFAKYRQGACA